MLILTLVAQCGAMPPAFVVYLFCWSHMNQFNRMCVFRPSFRPIKFLRFGQHVFFVSPRISWPPKSTETQLSNYNQQHKRAAPPKNTRSENRRKLIGRHDQVQVPTNQRANAAIGTSKCMRALYSAANAPLYDHVFVSAIQRIHTRI